jgi:hypothetical protein
MSATRLSSPKSENRRALLCVDLDGTLVATDTLDECLLSLLRHRPLLLFLLPFWLLGGKAHFKERVAAAVLNDEGSRLSAVGCQPEDASGRKLIAESRQPSSVIRHSSLSSAAVSPGGAGIYRPAA